MIIQFGASTGVSRFFIPQYCLECVPGAYVAAVFFVRQCHKGVAEMLVPSVKETVLLRESGA